MTVKLKPGAMLEQLARMKSGTGRMRDATGLSPEAIQGALQTSVVPDDVAEIIVGYLGPGVLLRGEKSLPKKEAVVEESPQEEPAADAHLSVREIVEKVKSGELSKAEVLEAEAAKEKPRSSLFAALEELE